MGAAHNRIPPFPFTSDPTPATVLQALEDADDDAPLSATDGERSNKLALILRHALEWAVHHADVELVAFLAGLEGRWVSAVGSEARGGTVCGLSDGRRGTGDGDGRPRFTEALLWPPTSTRTLLHDLVYAEHARCQATWSTRSALVWLGPCPVGNRARPHLESNGASVSCDCDGQC